MRLLGFFIAAALLLGLIAQHRAPEYDEAYSIFLTAGDARPAWPVASFTAGAVRQFYTAHAGFGQIAQNLKQGDVHPPLYFWILEAWRHLLGPSWFIARLLSVAFCLGSLGLLAWLAAATEIPVIPTLAIALFSYGFAYTGIVARGFAAAGFLNLLAFCWLFQAHRTDRRSWCLLAGLIFGAASFTNYLAIFTCGSALLWLCIVRWRLLFPAIIGLIPFLAGDAVFFLAQRNSRIAQFAPFSPTHALALLAKDFGAALFGGLPLYAGRAGPETAAALLVLFLTCLGCVLKRRAKYTGVLALAVIAPPCGLLLLGIVFHNTPIEIRYLAFSMPFLALLFAASLNRPLLITLLAVQACGLIGLAFAHPTMQPQALAAQQAVALNLPGALILLPFGNDGVGIPGPFIAALPNTARVELLHPNETPPLKGNPNIILATIRVDAASRTAIAQALAYFQQNKCFKTGPATNLTAVFLNRCPHQQP